MDLGVQHVQLVNRRAFYVFVWWPCFVVLLVIAFVVALALDPGGFDACEATPSATIRGLQYLAGAVALGAAAALAARRLRGALLAAAIAPVALGAVVWIWLLAGPQSC